jgi:hypothetical protein
MDRKRLSRNDPCPCGSGKKYKHCCLLKMKKDPAKPSPTITDLRGKPKKRPKIPQEFLEFFKAHGSVAISEGILGCPHEEGKDFPEGEDCPFCPFWAGK